MAFIQHLLNEAKKNKDLHLLLIIGGLYSLSIALSNTFVNVYLWKQSGDFIDIGLYNLAVVVVQPITFIFAGRLAKKVDRIIVLRLGVIFLTLFYLMVLVVGENATSFLLLIGALLGIGFGFYWMAYNVLTFEITEPETRDFFNGFTGVLTSAGGMVGPIVAGFIISRLDKFTGYTIVFGISLFLFVLAVILSFFIEGRPSSGRYMFTRILQERKHNRNWRFITNAHFFQGLREGTFMFVISILVYIQTGSELALGIYGLVHSAVAFVAYYLAGKFIKPHMRNQSILFGGILLYLAVFLIVIDLTFTKLIIYAIVIAVAYPILLVPYNSLSYDTIGKAWNAAEMRIEYIVVREIFLHFGRIVSIIGFLISVAFFSPKESLPIFLSIAGLGHTLIYFCVRTIDVIK